MGRPAGRLLPSTMGARALTVSRRVLADAWFTVSPCSVAVDLTGTCLANAYIARVNARRPCDVDHRDPYG
jgi:hypothetical protein